jgi:hypothetical protein
MDPNDAAAAVDLGPVAPEVERLLAAGVAAYRRDRPAAELW